MTSGILLSASGVQVAYGRGARAHQVLRGVALEIERGEIVAVVGESGSGKSTFAQTLLGLLPDDARVEGGSVRLGAEDLLALPRRAMRRIRGVRIGYVPQDPSHSLNPLMRVGDQIAETLRRHRGMSRAEADARAREILDEVGIADPSVRARQYPHELSGGMRQRVLIGIAWSCEPELVIADEPTSALDATVQRRVLDRIQEMSRQHGTAVLLITHDLAVAADRADRIVVLQNGEVVETGPAQEVLAHPQHAYTQRLVAAVPGRASARMTARDVSLQTSEVFTRSRQAHVVSDDGPLVSVAGLSKTYTSRSGGGAEIAAVRAADFEIGRGSTFAIVGESGSGKSTTARMVARIIDPTTGDIRFDGQSISALRGEPLRQLRRRIQVVYQNPFGSLDPRMRIGRIVEEPLRAFGIGDAQSRRVIVRDLLDCVRLSPELAARTPTQLSGGQRQRIAIARALALRPELVVLDEPVSALDVSVQEQVLQLLVDLQSAFSLTYLFISHDLGVVRQISDHVAVMRNGAIIEQGSAQSVLSSPHEEYTRELIAAIPGAHS